MSARLTRTAFCCVIGLLLACATRDVAAQAIPAPMLADLKASTVFVKVNRRTLDWSGSGFVIQKSKGSALIVTNAHVLQCPKIDDADIAKNLPKETMKMIVELQKEVSGVESAANIVFFSGTPDEIALPGAVVAQDDVHDLAVLKVEGVPETVKPIKPNMKKIPELTPLITLGFPFGGMLAQDKTNPTITITRAELTSYKPVSDDMSFLQLQGSLNPGCSGGPVVDTDGKLCGVQVQTIRGSGLGFAIPTDQVARLVQGRLSTWRLTTKKDETGGYSVEYRVRLVDPMQKIKNLELYYLPGAVPVPSVPEFRAAPTALNGAKSVELKREGQWAVGTLTLPISGAGPLVATIQPSWTDGSKKKLLGRPEVVRISLAPGAVGPDDGRTVWHYVDKNKGEGRFIKTATGWNEEDDSATHHFAEVSRDAEKVQLLDANRQLGMRLFHERASFKVPRNKKWINIYHGSWEATGTVVAPN
ncbi:MAG TPA: trypsin-like peptidase domain-containing protein [Pirellulales bacterium]|jgi:S1-C subfamily serine protease|nr:trypsin-like peptidase domain-containing protein [Pirellulales bacterium]